MPNPLELFAQVQLFEQLTPAELERVYQLFDYQTCPAGQVIFPQGEVGDRFYIIADGAVRISVNIPKLGEENLVVLRQGAYFGEMALIDDAPRSASATAHQETKLLFLDADGFQRLIGEDLEVANKILLVILRILFNRNRETNSNLKNFHIMNGIFG